MKFQTGKVAYPLGAASYLYQNKDDFLKYLHGQLRKKKVKISIGAQPNSSPHIGTLVVFSLAFALGKVLKEYDSELDVTVVFEMVDTAPGKTEVIDGKKYQINLKESGILDKYIDQYYEILKYLSEFSGIPYEVRKQEEFNKHTAIPNIIKNIMDNEEELSKILDPQNNIIRIRSACPVCGLTDKHGIDNKFIGDKLICTCPLHGDFTVDIKDETEKLEYNTPLRNLIRAILYSIDNIDNEIDYEWLRITGSDYAGFYQEQLLYKAADLIGYTVSKLPIILYAPLITDWSGAKLSKSLEYEMYDGLPDFIINYENLKKEKGKKGLEKIFNEVLSWVENPYKLFRNYSIYYFLTEVLKE